MSKAFLVIALIIVGTQLHAQLDDKRNTNYLEMGGTGGFASINYERIISKAGGMALRGGIGMYSENAFYLGLPVSIHYLFNLKKPNTFIDVSVGGLWLFKDAQVLKQNESHFFSFVPSVGYRKHFGEKGFFRVAATPIINKNGFVPWLGLAIGRRF